MTWLSWRQFRAQSAVVGGVLVLLGILILLSGLSILHQYHSCEALHTCSSGSFTSTDQKLQTTLQAMLVIAPALVGIFWGAPLVARELETGSYRLGWTQSVTRRRWLAIKLAVVGLASVAVGGLLSLMVTWWFSPIDTVTANVYGTFDTRGITPIGYAFFAFALGVTLGVLWRRTLPAMATTLVAFVLVRVAVLEWIRTRLLPASHTVLSLNPSNANFGASMTPSGPTFVVGTPSIPNAMVLSSNLVAKVGHESSTTFIHKACAGFLRSLPTPSASGGGGAKAVIQGSGPGGMQACFDKVAAAYNQAVVYQPSSHYWPLQGMESALFAVLAAALLGLSFWWVRHRLS
jgi:hypothetical protein